MPERQVARADVAVTPLRVAEGCGVTRRDLLSRADLLGRPWLDAAQDELPRCYAPMGELYELCATVRKVLRDVDVVTLGVEAMPSLKGLGELGYMLLTAPTVEVAVGAIPVGFRVLSNTGFWETRTSDRHTVLIWNQNSVHWGATFSTEVVVFHMALTVLQQLAEESVPVEKITFRHSPFGVSSLCPDRLGVKVEYWAANDSIVLRREVLGLRPRYGEEWLHERVWLDLNDLLQDPALARTSSEILVRRLGRLPLDNANSLTDVASMLGVGCDLLRRELKREGATFADIKQKAMRKMARRLLLDERLSPTEVASTMKMTPSSFSRFYRREFGEAPSSARGQGVGEQASR